MPGDRRPLKQGRMPNRAEAPARRLHATAMEIAEEDALLGEAVEFRAGGGLAPQHAHVSRGTTP